TGTELYQLVHAAAVSFPRVALYFENSLLPPDLPLLRSAAAPVTRIESSGSNSKTFIDSPFGVGLPWSGPAMVDGHRWPAMDGTTLWLPPGSHTVEAGGGEPAAAVATTTSSSFHLLRFTGDLKAARMNGPTAIEFSYESAGRAIAI